MNVDMCNEMLCPAWLVKARLECSLSDNKGMRGEEGGQGHVILVLLIWQHNTAMNTCSDRCCSRDMYKIKKYEVHKKVSFRSALMNMNARRIFPTCYIF